MDKHFAVREEGDHYADATLTAIGQEYSLVWYLLPWTYIVALLGDACNEAPLYISSIHYYDETSLLGEDEPHEIKFRPLFELGKGERVRNKTQVPLLFTLLPFIPNLPRHRQAKSSWGG